VSRADEPNRLAREAHRRAEGYALTALGSALVAITNAVAAAQGQPSEGWVRIAAAGAVAALSILLRHRWAVRAQWLRDTPRWWERQDEMPSVLPFPRLSAWLTARLGLGR
jgi:hypothetical protein